MGMCVMSGQYCFEENDFPENAPSIIYYFLTGMFPSNLI